MAWKKGETGNPNGRPRKSRLGRPKKGEGIVERFRENPLADRVINKIFKIAGTLSTADEHKDAMACAKIIADKLIPTLKATDLKVDATEDSGFILMPEQKPAPKQKLKITKTGTDGPRD